MPAPRNAACAEHKTTVKSATLQHALTEINLPPQPRTAVSGHRGGRVWYDRAARCGSPILQILRDHGEIMNMKCIPSIVMLLSVGCLLRSVSLRAGEVDAVASWPEFHGPGRTNISAEKDLLTRWPEDGPPLVWKYSGCGRGYSGVTIAEGKIFTAGDFGDEEMILALDLDGKLLWKAPNGAAWQGASPGSRTMPTYDEGTLYHMNPLGRLAAYDAGSGAERWNVDLQAEFDAKCSVWAFAENVIVDGDKVLCMPGGTKGRIVALNKRSGKTIWTNTDIEYTAAYCSPVIVTYRGVRQLVTLTQKSVVSVNVATGKLVWTAPFVPRSPQNALTPVFRDGYVFIACGHKTGGTLMKVDADAGTASTVWHRDDLDNCHGGAILIGDRLYGSGCRAGGKRFYCVNFLTGDTIKLDKTFDKVGITCARGQNLLS